MKLKGLSFRAVREDRLWAEIEVHQRNIEKCDNRNFNANQKCALSQSRALVEDAKQFLEKGDVDSGWSCLNAAYREMVFCAGNDELANIVDVLRVEASKLSGWRQEAIYALIGQPDSEQTNACYLPSVVIEALKVRDQYNENRYMQIALRRKNLHVLFVVMLTASVLLPLLSAYGYFGSGLNDWKTIIGLEVMGAIGASFSMSVTLTSSEIKSNIPDQILGAFITWMRPVIGSIAAVAAYILIKAGFYPDLSTTDNTVSTTALVAIGFISGFSERVVVRVVEEKQSR